MKHCIIVKFIPDISKKIQKSFIEQIQELFDNTKEIEGVHDIKIFKCCVDRDNRADIMIEMDMEKEALEEYDKSQWHLLWKQEYGRFIDTKTIFDYNDDKPFKAKKVKEEKTAEDDDE